ncbi:MAG TPA: hypothetical protein VKB78_15520 [Pirellulales bacterium]|nr:hypothetical protein [Pirellulales bacterium]
MTVVQRSDVRPDNVRAGERLVYQVDQVDRRRRLLGVVTLAMVDRGAAIFTRWSVADARAVGAGELATKARIAKDAAAFVFPILFGRRRRAA